MFRELPSRTPQGPRQITPDMEADAAHAGRFLRIFGALWAGIWCTVAFLLGGIFSFAEIPAGGLVGSAGLAMGAVGALLHALGAWQRRRTLELFRIGEEARGKVLSVELDTSQRINRRHPWRVRYRFESNGRAHEGKATFWTPDRPDVEVGARVVVLFAPGRPSRSLLWTRVTPGDEAVPKVRIGAASESAERRAEEELAEGEALEVSGSASKKSQAG